MRSNLFFILVSVILLAACRDEVTGAINGSTKAQEDYNRETAKLNNQRQINTNITNTIIAGLEKEKQQLISNGASRQQLAEIDRKINVEKEKQIIQERNKFLEEENKQLKIFINY